MFKKLKQKIIEEQTSGRGSPGCGASGFSQRSSETSALSPSIHRNRTSLTEQNDDNTSTPNREGMIIAETKRQMHETLELKEEEIAQLYIHIKQVVLQSEELKKQKEKSEKTAFEQLEKALSAAQLAEEAHRKVQAEMDEKMKAVEKANEEECVILQQELTRVKEEVEPFEGALSLENHAKQGKFGDQ